MLMVRKKLSCHDCGAEAIDPCESYLVQSSVPSSVLYHAHVPAYPKALPCRICLRNPETVGWYDMYSENWTFEMLGEGKVEPLLEDPTKQEQKLLDVIQSVVVKECCKGKSNLPTTIAELAEACNKPAEQKPMQKWKAQR